MQAVQAANKMGRMKQNLLPPELWKQAGLSSVCTVPHSSYLRSIWGDSGGLGMLWLWISLCLTWQGASSFMIHNTEESLCLQDSHRDARVHLQRCSVDSELQQWLWTDAWFLMNVGTGRCLSAYQDHVVQTVECDGGGYLQWECVNHKLISVNRSLELAADSGDLALTNSGKKTKWKSLDEGDICQDKLRSRRQSELGEFEFTEAEGAPRGHTMTQEQRAFLVWFYRTEDSTSWVFAMLALSFIALLVGCGLLVMGMMGNRNRRKIAKYKAAAAAASTPTNMEELQFITEGKEENKNGCTGPTLGHHLDNNIEPIGGASETEQLKPGEILVTWKDGNVSNLCPGAPEDGEEMQIHE